MRNYVFIFLLVMTVGCTKPPDMLERALLISGDNHVELEKVLNHYENEPLKLKAAQFLISNMYRHISYQNQKYVDRYYNEIDSVNQYVDSEDELAACYEAVIDKYAKLSSVIPDLWIVSADYLINNIDRAFDDWQNGLWSKHLNFEEFCEYLLPYKVTECQSLDNWREYLSVPVYGDMRYLPYSAHSSHSSYWACYTVHQKLYELYSPKTTDIPLRYPIRRMHTLLHNSLKKDCDDRNIITVATLRAKGIPAMIDFTPQWPNRKMGHSWSIILDNSGKNHRFQGLEIFEHTYLESPMAKVFRECYAVNPELLKLNLSGEIIPPLFRRIHIRDVTDEYQRTDDVTVKFDVAEGNYAYLSVFNNVSWTPVQYGKISGKKAVFKKMGRDVVYLPIYMSKNQQNLKPAAPPFILTLQGKIKPIVPDMTQRQTLTLTRKYPPFRFSSWPAELILGAKIQVANRADFGNAVTLHTITKYGTEAGEILLDTLKTGYRYWRCYSASDGHCSVAELNFFRHGQDITGQGKVIGSPAENGNNAKTHVFDGDPLTFFRSPDPSDSWVGLDFGEPVNINRILYIPHTDGNIVTYGDEYELKYWDGNGWNSLGRKVADNAYITFDNCPTGALFLLHDCTRGVEERIFTYENDEQIWW